MVLTIDIAPDLESSLYAAAAKVGVDPGEYVVETLRQRLRTAIPDVACLSPAETRLFDEINRGLSEAEWARYGDLIERRREERLTDEEQAELVALSDRLEQLNVRRLELLAELARLRNKSLRQLMDQLGIQPPPVF
jgi:hypothetical protein